MGHRWKVVDGDVAVREGSELVAQQLPERLPRGAVVEELHLDGDTLHFKRVSGSGPLSGWADVRSASGKELLVKVGAAPASKRKAPPEAAAAARPPKVPSSEKAGGQAPVLGTGLEWEVVSEGGVYAQKGQRASSMKLHPPLPFGTIVEEVERSGDRLRFLNRSGVGPASGWASIAEKGQEILVPVGGWPPEPAFTSLDDAKADIYRLETLGAQPGPPSAAGGSGPGLGKPKDGERAQPLGGWAAMAELFRPGSAKAAEPVPKGQADVEGKKAQDTWVALARRHGMEEQQGPKPAAAAELAEHRAAAREELPSVDALMRLDEGALTKLLGFDAVIAAQFSGLPRPERQRLTEEARTRIEGERLAAIEAQRRRAEAEAEAEAKAAAAAAAQAAAAAEAAEDDAPLAGWAALLGLLGGALEPRPDGAAAAAETLGPRRAAKELPPVGDLEDLDASALAELLGLDAAAARELAALSAAERRKTIAEAKALLELGPEKRQEYLEDYWKAWPRGPFPELTPPAEDSMLLPPGSCFPYSRHLREVPSGPTPEWGLDSPAGRALRTFFRRRATSHPEAQKEFLRSLPCDVLCTARPTEPDAGRAAVDPSRVGGSFDIDQVSGAIAARGAARPDDVLKYLNTELQRRVCLLDGDMAARIAQEHLGEAEYRGERFKNFKEKDDLGTPIALSGNIELLNLTRATLIADIHREYLLAGSDIVRTNTWGCNAISQKAFGMQMLVYEMSKAAAQLAKKAAAEVTKQEPARPRLVAGAIGPTPSMLSQTPGLTWASVVQAYGEQVKGLADGGVDMFVLDCVADSLNAKAAVFAIDERYERLGRKRPPVVLSAQIAADGRTPSGQSAEAFCISVRHVQPLALGLGSAAAGELQGPCRALASLHTGWCSACPGAEGQDPEPYAAGVLDCARDGLLNFIGGGAGAMPSHIAAVAARAGEVGPRRLPPAPERPLLQLAGLDACTVRPDGGFQVVGSQCTVMGSAKFKRKVGAYKATGQRRYLREALEVCVEQCEGGADILDFNLDSDLAAGPACPAKGALGTFLRMASAEPKVAKVPFMLCSCEWETVREGLRCVQGKCVVNGLSLALGEQEFLRLAKECKAHGAALVVLPLTDECEPAETHEDKVRICQQSYKLLRSKLDFPAEDIIFDCQVLPLGLPEFAGRAASFISAVAELKRTCPCASFTAGLNNLSLPFRGLNMLRDALHAVFLQHAIPKGLNMAMAWPGALPLYSDLDAETRALCEEMILNASADARHLERFSAFVNFRADTATCLPVRSPGLWAEAGRRAPAVQKEAAEMQKQIRAGRAAATPQQQKLSLRSLGCTVRCNEEPLRPEAGAGLPDPCRAEGPANKELLAAAVVARSAARPEELARYFKAELQQRVCVLATPGPQGSPLGAAGYREYFAGGCDVCGTGTLASSSYEESRAAAQSAKEAAAEVTKTDRSRPRFVAGVLGPMEPSPSAPKAADPSPQSATWEELAAAYAEQVRGLADGGVDLLAIEMVSDTLSAKAAIFAVDEHFAQSKRDRPPLIITAVVAESGRLPCGQSVEAFLVSVGHAKPLSVGVSGPLGAEQTQKAAAELARSRGAGWCHAVGAWPGQTAGSSLSSYAEQGLLNFAGTCGLPAMVAASAAKALKSSRPRALPSPAPPVLRLAGLEALEVAADGGNIQLVGQRCNLGGSARFRGFVDTYKYSQGGSRWDGALEVCIEQCEAGADLLDFNFDSELIDSKWAMERFLRLCASEARVARVPFVLGSAEWPVIEAGLRSVRGKSVVSALSLVQGEEEFLRLAAACLRYGAAVVVMTVDSPGECSSCQGRVDVGRRAYELLRRKLDFPAEDIIFDCNIVPADRPGSVRDFLDAVAELKRTCPLVSFIGGVGNMSLPYRGAPPLREALHGLFLAHAIPMGLNMAIADLGKLPRRRDLEAQTIKICEEVILNESEDGNHTERLQLYGAYLSGGAAAEGAVPDQLSTLPAAIPHRPGNRPFSQPLRTLVQATGTITASIFQNFASKSHAAMNFHRLNAGVELRRQVWFSSISAWMGQGGTGIVAGASLVMDGASLRERAMGYQIMGTAVEWGAVGEIGLRRTLYGSRDVFAQFDLGQKLVSPENAQHLMRVVCCLPADPYEVIALGFLDQTWQMTLAGVVAGGGLDRKTFADA